MKLEQQLGKDQILETYLNTVYFGHGAYGVEAAAQTYFGKHASQLTILESASLAGVLHAPELYDPIDRPSDNWYRRNYAIDQMVRYGYLQKAEGDRLEKHKCCGTIADQQDLLVAPGQSEYFVSYVRKLLFDRYGEAAVYSGGMRVTTTLDLNLQRAAEHAIVDALPDAANDPAAALVSIDTQTGEILAMAGGRDWSTNKVNYATGAGGSGRQAGSAFKAFTLAAAMQQGYDLAQVLERPVHDRGAAMPRFHPTGRHLAPRQRGRRRGGHLHARRCDRTLGQHGVRTVDRAARSRARRGHGPRARHQVGPARGLLHHAGVGGREPAGDDERVRDDRRPGRATLGDAAAAGQNRRADRRHRHLAGRVGAGRATMPTW